MLQSQSLPRFLGPERLDHVVETGTRNLFWPYLASQILSISIFLTHFPGLQYIGYQCVGQTAEIMPSTRAFFPKADAAILTSKHQPPLTRPQTIGPILDPDNLDEPISAWSEEIRSTLYPKSDPDAPTSTLCNKPAGFEGKYPRATLAHNEALRLSMLWYYTRDVLKEEELLSGLQEKAHLAKESTGWEFAIIGILDINVYIRLATVGVHLGILPRGETLCAHTVIQPPGVSATSTCELRFCLLIHI